MSEGTASMIRCQPVASATIAIAAIGAATILGAWIFQYGVGLKPCPLCLEQRYAYYFAIPLAVMVLLGDYVGASRKVLLAPLVAIALGMLWNAGLGVYHSGVVNAIEPGLATTGGPLILASSPHARRGVLWDTFKRHYGPDGDPHVLVAHGASRTLNPSLTQRVVDRALEKDCARATAEYLAEFRTDVEGFVSIEVVESCVGDYREQMPASGLRYFGFTDPSGGSEAEFAKVRQPAADVVDR